MGGLAFIIAYTILIGIIELQFDVTVGQRLLRLAHWLAAG